MGLRVIGVRSRQIVNSQNTGPLMRGFLPFSGLRTGTGLALLFFITACYVHQVPSRCPTPVSRLDLLHAMIRGTFCIDQFGINTSDKAEFRGHFYSDKAPGTAVLALPAFITCAAILKTLGKNLESDSGWLISSWVACGGSIAIVTALGAACLFSWLSKLVPQKHALVTVLALFLGGAPLPYATMMFSHSLVYVAEQN